MFARLMEQLQQSGVMRWYLGREPQERPIIAGLALLVVLSLAWLLVWKPIADWREVSENRLVNARSALDWIQANEAAARAAARGGGDQPGVSLPVITRVANRHGLTLNRLQPEGSDAVSVVLQAQSFNTMLKWLDELERQHKITVARVSLDAEGNPGLVNAQLRLE
jgi:general secretion pathway protein M